MTVDVYNQKNQKVGEAELPDTIFAVKWNPDLVHQVLTAQSANHRVPFAHAKGRGEVRGGGKKPWRQKGTGRARFGSSRNPIWRGGGIVFGPIGEANYSKNLPKKARRLALFSSLSQKATEGSVFVLDSFEVKTPKTKVFMDMVGKLPVERSLLVVLSEKDSNLEKSANNLPNVKTILVNYLNIFDLLKYEKIMFLEPALKKAEELFLN